MVRFKCKNCGESVDLSKNDVDIDLYVEDLNKDYIVISFTATAKCPACGEPLFEVEDTLEYEIE